MIKLLRFRFSFFDSKHEPNVWGHVQTRRSQNVNEIIQITHLKHIFNASYKDANVEIKLYLGQNFEKFDQKSRIFLLQSQLFV